MAQCINISVNVNFTKDRITFTFYLGLLQTNLKYISTLNRLLHHTDQTKYVPVWHVEWDGMDGKWVGRSEGPWLVLYPWLALVTALD